MGWDGLATLAGKIAERFIPTKKESIANQIEKLEGKINDLQNEDWTTARAKLYIVYTSKLSKLRKKAKNN